LRKIPEFGMAASAMLKTGQLAHGDREALQKEYGVVFDGRFITQRKWSQWHGHKSTNPLIAEGDGV
jgi:hypothetical protein